MIASYVRLIGGERHVLLFGVACAFLSSPGQTYFISLFADAFGQELGLGPSRLGSLYLIATLGAASLLPFAGHWIDRLDLRLYAPLVMAGLAAACGVMAGATGTASLLLALMLLRLTGQGLMTHVAATSIARYFDAQRGRALSIVALGFAVAEGTLPAAAVAMNAAVGWRMTYALAGVAVLLVAAPLLVRLIARQRRFAQPPGITEGRPPRALDGLKIVVRTRFFWLALPILLFMPFTSTALIFHIKTIAAGREWSGELIALGFTGYALGHGVGLLLSGPLVDRLGARAMLVFMDLPMLAGVAALGLFVSPAALLLFLGLMGTSSGLVQTTGAAVWAEVYGIARLGTIRSFAVMLMVAGTALGPAVVGMMIDAHMPLATISSYLLGAGLAGVLLAAVAARQGRVS